MTHPARPATRIGAGLALALVLLGHMPTAAAADGNTPPRMTYQSYLTDANGVALGSTGPKNYDVVFRIYNDQNSGNDLWSEQQTVTVDNGYFSALLGEGSQVNTEPNGMLNLLFRGTDISDRYVEMTVKGIGTSGADVAIKPRLRLISSPYAFTAQYAIYAANLVNSSNATVMNVSGSFVGINKLVPTSALDVTGDASVSGVVNANTLSVTNASVGGNETVAGTLTAGAVNATTAAVSGTISASNFVGNGTIPVGGIIMWSGAINNIPAGWALCNGGTSNGLVTPNLVDRFVIGAGNIYAVGGIGGATNTTLNMNQIPAHTHHYKDGYLIESLSSFNNNGGATIDGYDQLYSSRTGNGSLDQNNDTVFYRWLDTNPAGQASPTPVPTLPSYYALAYIMRVK